MAGFPGTSRRPNLSLGVSLGSSHSWHLQPQLQPQPNLLTSSGRCPFALAFLSSSLLHHLPFLHFLLALRSTRRTAQSR